jgi:integrase/recombinase XerD
MTEQNKADFTAYLSQKNVWLTTIEKYIHQVNKFADWLELNKQKTVESAQKKDILDYLQAMQQCNLSGSTRRGRLVILNHYYTFLYQAEQTAQNPTAGIKLRGTKRKLLPNVLTVEEMEQLLDTHFVLKVQNTDPKAVDTKGKFVAQRHTHQRNHLILSFCIYQGLIASEWQQLTLDDIDLQKATLTIRAQRKTAARKLPLHATQIPIIYDYIYQSRPHFNLEGSTLLNPKLQTHDFAKELRKMFPKFKDLTQLRASIITHWIKTEGLRKAQYKAGHRYISSTENYLINDLESLKEDITRFHPLH